MKWIEVRYTMQIALQSVLLDVEESSFGHFRTSTTSKNFVTVMTVRKLDISLEYHLELNDITFKADSR